MVESSRYEPWENQSQKLVVVVGDPFLHAHILSSFSDGTWEITVYFRPFLEYGSGKGSDLWIPTDTTVATAPLITNIKSMSSEPLCLQLYLEHPSLSESRMDALTRHPMHI
ncbi:hypothetical protein Lal_00017857 [Lupinus albus]|nr:hypothetical protein Lal_00017857 [Lupinus albus]